MTKEFPKKNVAGLNATSDGYINSVIIHAKEIKTDKEYSIRSGPLTTHSAKRTKFTGALMLVLREAFSETAQRDRESDRAGVSEPGSFNIKSFLQKRTITFTKYLFIARVSTIAMY